MGTTTEYNGRRAKTKDLHNTTNHPLIAKTMKEERSGQHRTEQKEKTLTKEGNSFSPIQQSMVVGERDDHDGSDDDFAVYDYGFVFDCVHAW